MWTTDSGARTGSQLKADRLWLGIGKCAPQAAIRPDWPCFRSRWQNEIVPMRTVIGYWILSLQPAIGSGRPRLGSCM
jgi:hypothetical protein